MIRGKLGGELEKCLGSKQNDIGNILGKRIYNFGKFERKEFFSLVGKVGYNCLNKN